MRATELTTEYERDPIGLGTTNPRFSWRLEATDVSGGAQLAYEIEVRSSDAVIWNTGRVDGSAQVLIPYAGQALESRQRCSWAVRVWSGRSDDGTGTAGPWSSPASFEMGLLHGSDWAGTEPSTPASSPTGGPPPDSVTTRGVLRPSSTARPSVSSPRSDPPCG